MPTNDHASAADVDTTSSDATSDNRTPNTDSAASSASGSDRAGSGGRRRRGRRGGRGRRGSGGGSSDAGSSNDASSDVASSDVASSDGASSDGASSDGGATSSVDDGEQSSSGQRRGGRRGGRRGSGGGRGSSRGDTSGGGSGRSTNGNGSGKGGSGSSGSRSSSGADDRGAGTRMAAKKQRRSGGRHVAGISEDLRQALRSGPPKTMLVSADGDRTQIAVLEERTLVEHHVTNVADKTLVGNVYMARVQNVLPGMEAAFLDIGTGRNGVLYAGEVLYDDLDVEEGSSPRIEDALSPGQKTLVQVTKDAMGTKGPRLTMQLSLAGRYTVLAPNSDVFGISRKLTDKERDRLRTVVKKVKPSEHGVIVRTAAEDAPAEQLEADLSRLLRVWAAIEEKASTAKALTSVYEEPPLHVKLVRDSFGSDYEHAIIDGADIYDAVVEYLGEVTPTDRASDADKVQLYGAARWEREHPDAGEEEERPRFADLFDAYNVTEQLRKALSRKVWLPSGGYLIIEVTEAMKVIDVNTGKYTGGKRSNLEEVVFKTNLEAAEEIVRQLRLRDMGGIIIIDFIDMLKKANQEQVVATLKRELLRDRTKTRVSDVSRLGLVQMTRKNVSHGLIESFGHRCATCDGTGWTTQFD